MSSYKAVTIYYAIIAASATQTGMVIIESIVEKPHTCDASDASRPYLAANMAVLLAVGVLTNIETAIRVLPVSPQSLNSVINISGLIISLMSAEIYMFF